MKRGFTLIELLAVMTILGIILTIAIPSISGIVESTYGDACDINLGMMKKATRNYIDFGLREPPLDNEPIAITIDELRSNDMITAVVDPRDRTKTCEGYVVVKKDHSGYIYTPYIKCESDCLSSHYGELDIDMTPPDITIIGSNPISINRGDNYVDTGATANDDVDGNLTDKIVVVSTVNTNVIGNYTVTYTVIDSSGNSAVKIRTVNVIDSSIPVITLLGDNNITIPLGVVYVDKGATAVDDVDGDITKDITTESNVNINVIGVYNVTYNVSDSSGNKAISVIRTVNIVDNTLPLVTFSPNGNSTYAKSRTSIVTVTDNWAINTSSLRYQWTTSIVAPSEASFSSVFTNDNIINSPAGATGGYYLWILAKDTSNNTIITRSNVFNLDNTKPIITMNGSSLVSIYVGSIYNDAGATATDDIDGNITSSISTISSVNPNILGTYIVTYNVSDLAGNTANSAIRSVNVIDPNGPSISISPNGNGSYVKSANTTVTVTDNVGINASSLKYIWSISGSSPSEGSFSTSFTNGSLLTTPNGVTGNYYLWILAKDTSGNTTIVGSNPFNLDNTIPTITLTGSSPITISLGSSYTDAGATANDNINGNITSRINVVNNVNSNAIGSYTVTYNVTDTSGNIALPVVRTVNVTDTTDPSISFGTNGNSNWSMIGSSTITASDASGLSVLKYLWNTSTVTPSEASFSSTFTNGSSVSSPTSLTGSYYLWALAKDNSNNVAIVRTSAFKLDNTDPVCSTSGGSSSWKNSSVTITVTCSDANSGLALCGSISTSPAYQTFSSNIDTTQYYNVKDVAGNTSTCSARVRIDKTPPSCTISGGSTTWITTDRPLVVTCSDTGGSGVATPCSGTWAIWSGSRTTSSWTAYDNAGNGPGFCTATSYQDQTPPNPPSISGSTTKTVTCGSDLYSGIKSSSCLRYCICSTSSCTCTPSSSAASGYTTGGTYPMRICAKTVDNVGWSSSTVCSSW